MPTPVTIIVSASNINVTTFFTALLGSDQNITNVIETPTSKSWTDPSGQRETLYGTNFTYAPNGDFSGGTLTRYQVSDSNGNAQLTINGLNVPILPFPSSSNGPLAALTSGLTDYFAVNGSGDTVTTYGSVNNVSLINGGNTVIGAAGTTTVSFISGSFGNYTITPITAGTYTVAETSGPSTNGTNTVTNVTTLHFFDGDYSVGTGSLAVSDSAADVSANLNEYQALASAGKLSGITLVAVSTPTLSISSAQLTADATALHDITGTYNLAVSGVTVANTAATLAQSHVVSVSVADSASAVSSALDSLQSLAASGKLSSISVTDTGVPNVTLSGSQLTKDAAALHDFSGSFALRITADASSESITGLSGHGAAVVFSGNAAQYTITPSGNGGLTVSNGGVTDQLSNVTALQFADHEVFVAAQTPAISGGVSSFQVTSLYAAVFGRQPDVGGLAYYENIAATQPSVGILNYAQWFLSSPEYVGNPSHNYAQTSAGDAQFVIDTYTNLLNRAPGTGDVSWYQTNVINPYLAGLTPGTSAYASAELAAHATVLADFSQSLEFKGDVQITAQAPVSSQHWLLLT